MGPNAEIFLFTSLSCTSRKDGHVEAMWYGLSKPVGSSLRRYHVHLIRREEPDLGHYGSEDSIRPK
jgi:hypothetical protein